MGDTYLRVLSFNTHLFGYTVESQIGEKKQHYLDHKKLIHDDDQRKQQLKAYLNQSPPLIDLFALLEVWSAQYAYDFQNDLSSTFPSFFARNPQNNPPLDADFNPSGVCLQGIQGTTFSNQTYFDYIDSCDHGFDSQDKYSGKGYLSTTVELSSDFDSAIKQGVSFGFMGTHMITSQNHHHDSAECSYNSLASQLKNLTASNQPALLFGDLNTTEAAAPVWYDQNGSLETSVRECSAFIYNVLLAGAPPLTSEAFITSRTAGQDIVPVTCYNYEDRYMFAVGVGPGAGGWEPCCVPFYVPTSSDIPVYSYSNADQSGDYFYLSTQQNSGPPGWAMSDSPVFYSLDPSASGAVGIYEWYYAANTSGLGLYGYFPQNTTMPPGWEINTGIGPAFYAFDLLHSDPGYSVDSTTNSFWASVNSPYGKTPTNPVQQRIDYIFLTNPPQATTTFEVVEADILVAEPALRIKNGTEDISDHFPLFAVIKVSDPSISSDGVIPVMCYTYGGRYLYSTVPQPRTGGWRLLCAPFFVPANNAGDTPIYLYYCTPLDGSGDHFRLSTVANDPSMSGWTPAGVDFNAVSSSDQNAVPIYEWTLPPTGAEPTRYAYFPAGTIMLPGWTMAAEPMFYGSMRRKLV